MKSELPIIGAIVGGDMSAGGQRRDEAMLEVPRQKFLDTIHDNRDFLGISDKFHSMKLKVKHVPLSILMAFFI